MTLNTMKTGLCGLFLVLTAIAAGSPDATAQTTQQRQPTLRQRLTAGLQARRPSEVAFVNAVVETVDRGELSENLVNRVFFWARTRPQKGRTQHRPIIYFQPALERIAEQGRRTIRTDAQLAASLGT